MRTIKADFHLHTYHSDNQDRMTPHEYAALGRSLGYDVLGFCDHHHNLTQAAWQTLQAEVAALSDTGLLLTTGYEATFVVGHLCVLNKCAFDGESVADCRRQLWSPANTRILAHPDNNACAWLLPLPVGVQGVEVINGGQDLYAYRATSLCSGLPTYMRYLLLNHRVAAVAQSDCHQRAIFGRVWTGLLLPDATPLRWDKIQAALARGHSFAAMGDLHLQVWSASGATMGDTLAADGDRELLWETAPGAEVTVYVADRPVAYIGPSSQSQGRYRIRGNGPHWLLAKRGLAWAVSSPVWVESQTQADEAVRARLAADSAVQRTADALRRRLDWLESLQSDWSRSALPVADYVTWLRALLPDQWPAHDWGWEPDRDPAAVAQARLAAALQIATPVLADVLRASGVQPQPHSPSPRVHVATPSGGAPGGLIQFAVDVPRDWAAIHLTGASGQPVPHVVQPIDSLRDPIAAERTRSQLEEIYVWLTHGEMHEYVLRNLVVEQAGGRLTIQIDLYPAELGLEPLPDPAAAEALRAKVADPEVATFYVHLRMPRRFAVVLPLEPVVNGATRSFTITEGGRSPDLARIVQYATAGEDPAEHVLAVQVG